MPLLEKSEVVEKLGLSQGSSIYNFQILNDENFSVLYAPSFLASINPNLSPKGSFGSVGMEVYKRALSEIGGLSTRFTSGSVLTDVGVPRVLDPAFDVFPRIEKLVAGIFEMKNGEMTPGETVMYVGSLAWDVLPDSVKDAIQEAVTEAVEQAIVTAIESVTDGAADAVSTAGYVGQIIAAVLKTIVAILNIVKAVRKAKKSAEEMKDMISAVAGEPWSTFNRDEDQAVVATMKTKLTSDSAWTEFFLPPFHVETLQTIDVKLGYRLFGDSWGFGFFPLLDKQGNIVDIRRWLSMEFDPRTESAQNTGIFYPGSQMLGKSITGFTFYNGFPTVMRVDWDAVRDAWATYAPIAAARVYAKVREVLDKGKPQEHDAFIRTWLKLINGVETFAIRPAMGGAHIVTKYGGSMFRLGNQDSRKFEDLVPEIQDSLKNTTLARYFDRMKTRQWNAVNSINSAYMRDDDVAFQTTYGMGWKSRLDENKRAILEHKPTLCRVDRKNIRDPDYLKEVNKRLFGKEDGPTSLQAIIQACPMDIAVGPGEMVLPPTTDPYKKPMIAHFYKRPTISEKTFMQRFGPALAAAGVSGLGVYYALKHFGVLDRIKT